MVWNGCTHRVYRNSTIAELTSSGRSICSMLSAPRMIRTSRTSERTERMLPGAHVVPEPGQRMEHLGQELTWRRIELAVGDTGLSEVVDVLEVFGSRLGSQGQRRPCGPV